MKATKITLCYILVFSLLLISFFYICEPVYAGITIPKTVKIGLSYGGSAANLFNLTSETGIEVGIVEKNAYKALFSIKSSGGLRIRKDVYYNIVNGSEKEINYVKAAKYEGEVIGPYHIQIGDTFSDIETARQLAEKVVSITPFVFLVYEDGWRVWSQLYLEESECKKQIQIMQNEMPNLNYSVIHPEKKRIQILDSDTGQLLYILNSDVIIKVIPQNTTEKKGMIQYKSKKYRGSITLQSMENSDITVVNELPLQEYLYSVVSSEMPSEWPMEALKAQAVAARNYALYTMGKHEKYGFDLCASEHCQAYNGVSQEKERSNEAVDATKDKILLYNGNLVSAFYHSSSGGYTEDIENIWSGELDYIKGVEDKFSLGSPYDSWILELDKSEIEKKLEDSGEGVGTIKDIRPLEISKYGRVTKIEIKGTKDTKVFERERLRYILGTTSLKSIWYELKTDADIYVKSTLAGSTQLTKATGMTVISSTGKAKAENTANRIVVKGMSSTKSYSIVPNKYTFNGKGFGHGLGMSQYGAKGMAEAGYNYEKILEYYYQGAKVQ